MTEQVLTGEEKEALLDGVATGEVEVLSSDGAQYAGVRSYEFPARSRIVTNSYPRLQTLNQRFAGRLSKYLGQLFNTDVEIAGTALETSSYGEFCERNSQLALLVQFSASPLSGSALIRIDVSLVGQLVDSFFGGSGTDPSTQNGEFFTPGEISVAALFSDSLLQALGELWESLAGIEPERVSMHLSTDIIDVVDSADDVISCEFEILFREQRCTFYLVWPKQTVAPLLPVFEGQKRDRDPVEDARWEEALKSGVTESIVKISSHVGQTSMTLGQVAELAPGDIVEISNPRRSTVLAQDVPVLEGHFGVHDGRYAVETTGWLRANSTPNTV